MRDGLVFTLVVTVGVSALLFIARGPIADLFGAEGITRDLVFLFCGPLALAWFFNGVIFLSNAAFNNLGHPFYSTWINWGRHTLGTIPFVIVGAAWWQGPGVLIGQALGGAVFAAVAMVLAAKVMRDKAAGAESEKPHPFARQTRQIGLFNLRR
jgi:Na+-driven multidrug efflux pump